MIVIVGDRRDPHVEAVRALLRHEGSAVSVFSRYDAEARVTIRVEEAHGPRISFRCDGEEFSGNEVESVWWRQKPFDVFGDRRTELECFKRREWHAMLDGLEDFLPFAKWMNRPSVQRRANHKPLQLAWALSAGFNVPNTAFTNSVDEVEGLRSAAQSIVYKPFTPLITAEGEAIFTTDVTDIDLDPAEDSIAYAPGIYQQLLSKHFEVRLIFVGDENFYFKIRSQERSETALDWRHDQEADMFEFQATPTDIAQLVRRFRALSGLDFGAIDLVVDATGAHYFLECNPAGQYLWIEHQTGVAVSNIVGAHLARPSDRVWVQDQMTSTTAPRSARLSTSRLMA